MHNIGTIGNYYGGLFVHKTKKGQCKWLIAEDESDLVENVIPRNIENAEDIPVTLYDELVKFEKERRTFEGKPWSDIEVEEEPPFLERGKVLEHTDDGTPCVGYKSDDLSWKLVEECTKEECTFQHQGKYYR